MRTSTLGSVAVAALPLLGLTAPNVLLAASFVISPPAPSQDAQTKPSDQTIDLRALGDPLSLEDRLRRAIQGSRQPKISLKEGQAHLGAFRIDGGQTLAGPVLVVRGRTDVYGLVHGNVVAVDGDIVLHRGGRVEGDVVAFGGHVKDDGGMITGNASEYGQSLPSSSAEATIAPLTATFHRIAGLLGIFCTLAVLGFGVVTFGRTHLDIVSDTVTQSLLRSFVVGVLGQVLLLPTFAALTVGLVLSVVGILLLPFALIALGLVVLVGSLGGLIAVTHAMGEFQARRRMAAGIRVGTTNSYGYLLLGLGGFFSVWLAWALLGWVPIAGGLMWGAASLATWLLTTIGMGAMLLSRAGIRPNFSGRYLPQEALTDEYLWATPRFGVPAVSRGTAPQASRRDRER